MNPDTKSYEELRKLDAAIAEKIMGWKNIKSYSENYVGNPPDGTPIFIVLHNYSTDISAAWQVVEKLEELGYWAQLRTPFDKGAADSFYWCGFTPRLTTGWNGRPDHWTNAPTITMSICLAALKCVGVEAR